VHTGTIKSIVWEPETNTIITAGDDKTVRWWDLRQQSPAASYAVEGVFGSSELSTKGSDSILCVGAGKTAYFFPAQKPGQLLKSVKTTQDIAAVGINWEEKQFVTGSSSDTWVRVFDYDSGRELQVYKGHHGPVWTANFSPDGKLYATGSEDGTIKLWKFCKEPYGLWK